MGGLAAVAAAWLVGLGVGAFVPGVVWRAVAGLVVFAGGVALVVWGERISESARAMRLARWAACALVLVGGMGAAKPRARASGAFEMPRGLARVTAVVDSSEHAGAQSRSDVRVVSGRRVEDGAPVPAGAWVRVYGRALPAGARVRTLLSLAPHVPFRNPSPHPRWPSWRPLAATGHVPAGAPVRVLSRARWRAWLDVERGRVRGALMRTLDPRTGALARALVLGEGHAVSEPDRAAVRGAGLAHVLAVSGLHVAIVAGLLAWLAGRLWLRLPALAPRVDSRRVSAAAGIPCALGFAAFAGGAPSAWRAAWTAAIAWGLVLAGRRPKALSVGATAAMALAAADPPTVLRPGFLLSIAAATAIVTGPVHEGWLRRSVSLAARAIVVTAPMVLWWFGSVPLVGLAANVVLVPLASLVLVPAAAMHAAMATWLPALGPVTAPIFAFPARAFLAACETFALVPWGRSLPPPDLIEGLVIAAAAVALLCVRGWRRRALVAAVALLALGAAEAWLRAREHPHGVVRATFVDVGQGDAALIDLPDGRLMLVDAGGAVRGPDPGERVLVPLLAARRRSRIDVAVLTHAHPDHYGGLAAVLAHVHIGELWTTRQAEIEEPHGAASELIANARRDGTRVRYPKTLCGHPRYFGQARVRVLAPCPRYDPGYELNDNSLVVRVSDGRRSFLLTGDIEAHGEAALANAAGGHLRADVLKVPHHGSDTSSTAPFLAAVRPRVAVISVGAHNPFGHPAPSVVHRYRQEGTYVTRTDRMGGIVVTTDGHHLQVTTWRGDTWRAVGNDSERSEPGTERRRRAEGVWGPPQR